MACLQQTNVRTQSACSVVWCSTHAVRELEDRTSDRGTNGYRRGPSSQASPVVPQDFPPRRGMSELIGPKQQPPKRLAPTHIIPHPPKLGTFVVHDCMHTHAFLHAKRCAGVRPPPFQCCNPRGLPHSQGCRVEIPSLIRGTTPVSHLDAWKSGHLTSEHLPALALIESRQGSTHLRSQISASLERKALSDVFNGPCSRRREVCSTTPVRWC